MFTAQYKEGIPMNKTGEKKIFPDAKARIKKLGDMARENKIQETIVQQPKFAVDSTVFWIKGRPHGFELDIHEGVVTFVKIIIDSKNQQSNEYGLKEKNRIDAFAWDNRPEQYLYATKKEAEEGIRKMRRGQNEE
jgi:hypothetical protein